MAPLMKGKKDMKTKISHTDRDDTYIAETENDCKNDTDKQVFALVQKFRCSLSLGVVVGEPIDRKKEMKTQHKHYISELYLDYVNNYLTRNT
jgi:hypothetical protein